MDNCAACHLTNGKGAAGVFPAMSDNSLVTSDQTTGLIQTILYGAEMPSTVKRPEKLKMPGFAERLSDKDVAALATFCVKAGAMMPVRYRRMRSRPYATDPAGIDWQTRKRRLIVSGAFLLNQIDARLGAAPALDWGFKGKRHPHPTCYENAIKSIIVSAITLQAQIQKTGLRTASHHHAKAVFPVPLRSVRC